MGKRSLRVISRMSLSETVDWRVPEIFAAYVLIIYTALRNLLRAFRSLKSRSQCNFSSEIRRICRWVLVIALMLFHSIIQDGGFFELLAIEQLQREHAIL